MPEQPIYTKELAMHFRVSKTGWIPKSLQHKIGSKTCFYLSEIIKHTKNEG